MRTVRAVAAAVAVLVGGSAAGRDAPAPDPFLQPAGWQDPIPTPPFPSTPAAIAPTDLLAPPNPPPCGCWKARTDIDDETGGYFRFTGYADAAVRGQAATLKMSRETLVTPFPLYICGPDILAGTVRFQHQSNRTAARLPTTGRPLPNDLWDVSVGLAYIRKLDGGGVVGVLPRFGSPSDKPFDSVNELNFGATAFARLPAARDGDFWTLSVTYFPNSQVAFPVPGVAYNWHPSDRFKASLGVPFELWWQVCPKWEAEVKYTPVTQVTARVTHRATDHLRGYAGFEWANDGYFLAGRPVDRDLFFYFEKRVGGGLRWDPLGHVSLDVQAGWAFDRSFGVGRLPIRYKYDRVDVAPAGYLSGAVMWFF